MNHPFPRRAFEALESRRHLHSVTLQADGTLIVEGTAGKDRFILDQTSTRVIVQSFEGGDVNEPETPNKFVRKAVKRVLVYGLDGDDQITLGDVSAPAAVDAGKGNDTVGGGAGRDTLKGNAGRDTLFGGSNDDLIDGGSGNDSLEGGSGRDILDYRDRKTNVQVALGTSNCGEIRDGEKDFAAVNFEIVRGGHADDTLTTSSARDVTLLGGDGDDTMIGAGGDDVLLGGPGRDSMRGEAGVDTFYGKDGEVDTVDGGSSDDLIHDKDANDILHGIVG